MGNNQVTRSNDEGKYRQRTKKESKKRVRGGNERHKFFHILQKSWPESISAIHNGCRQSGKVPTPNSTGTLTQFLGLCPTLFMSQPRQNDCDFDTTRDVDTRKSTYGCIYIVARGAISWCSQLQQIVAFSTTKDEYIHRM